MSSISSMARFKNSPSKSASGPAFGISSSMRRSGSLGNLTSSRRSTNTSANLAPTFNNTKTMQGTMGATTKSSVTASYSNSLEAEYIKNLQQQIYFLELEANYLRDQAKKATDLQPRMTEEASRMIGTLKNLQSDVDSLHLEVQRKESNLDFVNHEKDRLDEKLKLLQDNHSREKKLLVEEIVQLKKQNEMLQREISDKETQIMQAGNELDKGSTSLTNAEHQIQIIKAQLDQKSERLKQTQILLEEKRAELLKSQTQYQELEEKYYSSTASIQDKAVQDIRDQVRLLQQKLKESELTAEQDRFLKNKISDDVNNLVKENALLGSQVLELQKQLERERGLRENRDERHANTITESVSLKEQGKQLKYELDQTKDELKRERDRVEHLMGQLVKQEQLNTTSSLGHNTTRSKLAEVEARYTSSEHENAQLRRDKMLLVDHVADLQKQVSSKERELNSTQSTFHTLNEQLKVAEHRSHIESSIQTQKWSEFEKMAESMKKLSQSMTARSLSPDHA
ncbi:uncharacterized protein [Amphiura filiformis]|uniref:uncharacterized protein n=1 Tax=Amphiura filiformis TaxID=82378 RepID=UPI003B21ADBD